MRKLTAALLVLAVLLSSLPWEASALVAGDFQGDPHSTAGATVAPSGSDSSGQTSSTEGPACLCPTCPGAAVEADPSSRPGPLSMPPTSSGQATVPDAPHSNDGLFRLFRPPRVR